MDADQPLAVVLLTRSVARHGWLVVQKVFGSVVLLMWLSLRRMKKFWKLEREGRDFMVMREEGTERSSR